MENTIKTIILTLALLLIPTIALAGSVTLSWDPPTTNSDGTPLTDLSGYVVYYGTDSGSYTKNIDIGNVVTYSVSGLTDNLIYHFAVTAYDFSGNESGYSNEVAATIEEESDNIAPGVPENLKSINVNVNVVFD